MVKFVFRWTFRLFILLIVLLVAGILLLDTIVKGVVERRLRRDTGMDVKIGSLTVRLWSPALTIENLKLYNTAEFGGSPLLDMPELHLEYDRSALFSHKLHYKLIRFNVAELNLVQNKTGKTNLRDLQDRQQISLSNTGAIRRKDSGSFTFAGIDMLNVSLGRATLVKMSTPGQVRELKLNVRNRIVPDIRSETDFNTQLFLILGEKAGTPLLDFISDVKSFPLTASTR